MFKKDRHYGGTGLGLWISKNILKLMGGKIGVSSTYGSGSRFAIEFPARVSSETKIFADSFESGDVSARLLGRRYLIVDDIQENTFLVSHILRQHGATVEAKNRAEDALELFRSDRALSAIITDLRMPGMSGQEFMLEIRRLEKAENRKPVPIVVVTGESDPEERMLCMGKYGATEFLLKPVKLGDLMLCLYKLEDQGQQQHERRLNVLIIEDENASAYFLSRVVTAEGHTAHVCGDIKSVSTG